MGGGGGRRWAPVLRSGGTMSVVHVTNPFLIISPQETRLSRILAKLFPDGEKSQTKWLWAPQRTDVGDTVMLHPIPSEGPNTPFFSQESPSAIGSCPRLQGTVMHKEVQANDCLWGDLKVSPLVSVGRILVLPHTINRVLNRNYTVGHLLHLFNSAFFTSFLVHLLQASPENTFVYNSLVTESIPETQCKTWGPAVSRKVEGKQRQ